MKLYHSLFVCALGLIGCDISIVATGYGDVLVDNDSSSDFPENAAVGPNHDADVNLASSDNWIVPQLPITSGDPSFAVTWTLLHPIDAKKITIYRHCRGTEAFLWLVDNGDPNSVIAVVNGCNNAPNETYGEISLVYDGTNWVGMSATGAAILLPPG